ncbi:MAG: alpha/beta hydrolase [Ruminococcus sp.]|uniref:alpha/beta hydrolase n=1 Tax=Ruminococcus sp. TaxID=41978 RepID=UPI0025DDF5A6|nr:alpha/beta hydrolase [Ruminococcus sp.]MCR5542379.1 alpha/beta hydrolase [Ruminococcus sp.]
MNKKLRKLLIIIAAVVPVLVFALMLWLASFVMTGKRQTLDEAMQWQSEHYDTSFYEKLEKTNYTVKSFDGYELHVQFLKNPTPTDKYMIISHGYTDNRMGALKYVPMYLELGYNCIIYDLRGHGENESTFTTYSIREGEDIAELVKDTRSRYSDISQLGLHGESLGAASTVASMKYKPDVDFAVADCGFSDIDNVLRGAYKYYHMPEFFVDMADLGARIRYGYSLKSMRPIDSLDDNEVPILFIHGAEDSFILPKNSENMAARTKGRSEVHFIEGAGHAESVIIDPENYKTYVKDFLDSL